MSKTQKVGEESNKYRAFRLYLNLNDYQFKTRRYSYRSTYMNSMVMTYKKSRLDTQKLKRKEHKHTTKENHQNTKKEI